MAEHVVQFPVLYQYLILKCCNLIAEIFVIKNFLFNQSQKNEKSTIWDWIVLLRAIQIVGAPVTQKVLFVASMT